MNRQSWMLCLATFTFGMLFAEAASPALAIGYYNLPGNFCQCVGYGNGAGYHSCLVLGPITPWGCCDAHETRVACPPRPPFEYYGGQCGYYGCGADYYEPTYYSPSSPPNTTPQPELAPAAMRPQVLR